MAKFIIRGRQPLRGEVEILGNKNAVLPMVAACLLTDQPVVLRNVPRIRDVQAMLDLIATLGVDVRLEGHVLRLCAARINNRRLDRELCSKVRSSILMAGPLAARHGRATLFPPGGDVIGRRRLDTHFTGLQALGIEAEYGHTYHFRRGAGWRGAAIVLDEASVTATENVLMAATLAPGETTIYNAACEPHVQDLIRLLNKMGARIEGNGTNLLRITGVERLGGAEHGVSADYIELGSYIAAGAVTGGELSFRGTFEPVTLAVMQKSFQRVGVRWTATAEGVRLPAHKRLRIRNDFGAATPKIEDGVWPAFPSDLMSVALVVATQAQGHILFFEKMFESRLYFVDHLLSMGAHIIQCDPHRVVVAGGAHLHGTLVTSPDIRAGMALIVAALCARGTSTICNVEMVERGYEDIDGRLRALGADITREA